MVNISLKILKDKYKAVVNQYPSSFASKLKKYWKKWAYILLNIRTKILFVQKIDVIVSKKK